MKFIICESCESSDLHLRLYDDLPQYMDDLDVSEYALCRPVRVQGWAGWDTSLPVPKTPEDASRVKNFCQDCIAAWITLLKY